MLDLIMKVIVKGYAQAQPGQFTHFFLTKPLVKKEDFVAELI